ncbi:MAG: acetate/propionate family kinase [Patescibacteria group bacterium]
MKKNILVLNCGSATVKFKVFAQDLQELVSGIVERIGLDGSFFKSSLAKTEIKKEFKSHEEAIRFILQVLEDNGFGKDSFSKIGHRVVHGGEKFTKPTLLNTKILKEIESFNDLAPLHNPKNISGIKICLELLPKAKNYAVFDTAFHSTLPEKAFRYALPSELYDDLKIRRYGFHGLSHWYMKEQAVKFLKKKNPNLITCHLGSGASICAIKNGVSVDTSMGFTPLSGLVMTTRPGDFDPSIILFLLRQGYNLAEIEKLLNSFSGLKGVCDLADLRDILILNGYKISGYNLKAKHDAKTKKMAKLALDMYLYQIQKYLGAYFAVLGGKVDAIVFSAGVGERNTDIRRLILKSLPFKAKVLVVPADEEKVIAMSI